MDNWTAPAGKWRGIIVMLLVTLPIGQRLLAQTFEFTVNLPPTTMDCIQSRNQTFAIRTQVNHDCTSGQPPCHQAEMSITGAIQQSWVQVCGPANVCGAPFAQGQCCLEPPGPGSCQPNTCGHPEVRDYGAVVAPGTYTVTMTFDKLAQGVSPYGKSLQPGVEAGWGLDRTNSCSRNGAPHVNPVGFGGGMTVHFIVPDFGQTTRLVALPPVTQKGFAGSTLAKPFSVKVETTDNEGAVTSKKGASIIFTVAGPNDGRKMSPVTVQTGDDGIASSVLTLGSSLGAYAVTAFCADCLGNQQVAFSATAVQRPQPKQNPEKPAVGPGACTASILPPPPLEMCVGDSLQLHCLCNPISAQRSVDWSPSTLVTKNFQVPEDAIFQSTQEGDFPVSLRYSVSRPPGTTPASCDASTVVKVRDVKIVGLSVDPDIYMQGGMVNIFAPTRVNLLVTLNRPHSDISAFNLVTVSGVAGAGASVNRSVQRGTTLVYELYFPQGGDFDVVVGGCAGSSQPLPFNVAPPIP